MVTRNLILLFDGTCNKAQSGGDDNETNVEKLYRLLPKSYRRNVHYEEGVGVKSKEEISGGAFGAGIDERILGAYRFLQSRYADPDVENRLFIFGFSRGAYTARSLSGLVTSCGLLDLSKLKNDDKIWHRVEAAEDAYRRKLSRRQWAKDWAFHGKGPKFKMTIDLVGVWDTVGALGIPDDMALLEELASDPTRHHFHDTDLGDTVIHARHAVAIDERRLDFSPTLWTNLDGRPPETTAKQIWFTGVHGDIGGGYFLRGLGDITLEWMLTEASEQGLEFRNGAQQQLKPDPQGILHDSVTGVFAKRPTGPRSVPNLADRGTHNNKIKRCHFASAYFLFSLFTLTFQNLYKLLRLAGLT